MTENIEVALEDLAFRIEGGLLPNPEDAEMLRAAARELMRLRDEVDFGPTPPE